MKLYMHLVTSKEINHLSTGAHARIERECKKISVRALAQRMEISAMYLSDLERGKRRWSQKLVNNFNKHCK